MTKAPNGGAPAPLLEVRNLRTYFHTDAGDTRAVDGISFSISAGKTLAVVGESGCGKTVTALSILQLIPQPPGEFASGEIRLFGRDLLRLTPQGVARDPRRASRHDFSGAGHQP
jgi:ABC-type dipeptide/oligopeptide/nickel transport system ATPase component